MTATVWTESEGADAPLATIGVALHSRCGARLWEALHAHAAVPVVTSARQQAAVPWCAVRLEPGVLACPQDAEWLGDYERVLAWAWMARRRGMQ